MVGYSRSELEAAEDKWGFRFPPDLFELLCARRYVIGPDRSIDWVKTPEREIRSRLEWPLRGLWFDVEKNNLWPLEWGDKPPTPKERRLKLKGILARAPKLIPLFVHRYIPDRPHEAGNPVFSVYQSDIIYYGINLDDYVGHEMGLGGPNFDLPIKPIEFWDTLVG